MSDLTCSGCGEYAGTHISDRIEELETKLSRAKRTLTHIRGEKKWNYLHMRRAASATPARKHAGTGRGH